MTEIDIKLEGYDDEIFLNDELENPRKFTITIPENPTSVTRLAADQLQEQLLRIIMTNNYVINVGNNVFCGDHIITLIPTMLLLKLEYVETPPYYLTFSFSLNEGGLVLH